MRQTAAPSSGDTAYEVTDVQGTIVRMPQKPTRILTLSMSTDEVVLGLVPPDHMAAVNSLLDDPVSSNVVELAQQVKGRVKDPTVEEIAAMQPDLVIVPDWGDITRVASLRDLGLPVVVCKGARNLAEIQETVRLIAQAVGEPERGERLVEKMDAKLAAITEQTKAIPESERKTVVLISLMSTYGGSGSSFDDACTYAGVTNGRAAAGIRDGQTMSKEQLVAINPDVLFLPTYNDHGAYDVASFRARYLSDPSLQTIRAIRDGRLEEPCEAYIYNCSQDFVFGVQEIAYRVYGDAFRQGAGEHLSAVDD
ncbi:ABC transporter substrate-binding protein [Selenomonas sp.]|uniref:ABC transporter substrate-binding protein n=1 Tax=Selenomonas sp. TaxID=2053611 RepID=UPI0025E028F7|nr:ABC transporter substrate-binding protein [Selenomonas sp.]MCI6085734.1 ABC transporter substrate-binding protein [Selenomonas sp.]MCI6283391.1 ABC transporter substrate-binding protein [Selenomonas sp.]MDY3296728.1 ABC transporter substrate-binding protein [Selenomonas sp.]MDY4415554.1 ABC transporter substrate-binding protein [Selenomonas sp.]